MPIMLCGHFFLKLSQAAEYQDASVASSLQVGALGGFLMAIPMLIVEWALKSLSSCSLPSLRSKFVDNESIDSSQETVVSTKARPFSILPIVIQILGAIASVVALGAGSGYFGSAVLRATGHDTLAELYATRAGAVGAAILGPGALVVIILFMSCCGGSALLFSWCLSRKPEEKPEVEKIPEAKV